MGSETKAFHRVSLYKTLCNNNLDVEKFVWGSIALNTLENAEYKTRLFINSLRYY